MRLGSQGHTPAASSMAKIPGAHCTGGFVGSRAGLDVCEKLTITVMRYPDLSARSCYTEFEN
jgi:hypothetical protein